MSKFTPIQTTKLKIENNEVPLKDGALIICTDGDIYLDNELGRHHVANLSNDVNFERITNEQIDSLFE